MTHESEGDWGETQLDQAEQAEAAAEAPAEDTPAEAETTTEA